MVYQRPYQRILTEEAQLYAVRAKRPRIDHFDLESNLVVDLGYPIGSFAGFATREPKDPSGLHQVFQLLLLSS